MTTFSEVQTTNSNNTITDNSTYNDNSVHNNLKTNIYKGLKQRKINSKDIAQLESNIVEKDSRILVQYLENSTIDTLLQKQIINTLSKLGYLSVFSSPAKSLPANLTSRRLNIQKIEIESQIEYRVIINPQQ